MKNSTVSEFSILPYVQNRKLGNLGKFFFTSNFCSSCNFRLKKKKKKKELSQKPKGYFGCETIFLSVLIFLFEGKIMLHSHDI